MSTMPRIAVLAVGDELLDGDLADTNTAAIARILAEESYRLDEAAIVGDREEAIAAALQRLTVSHQAVIVTGGLGPTEDDRTSRAAARAFDRSLSLNDQALTQIREHFRQRGRAMHPRNEKQALLPSRATVIPNPQGTAPGFQLRTGQSSTYFLPGVPAEMLTMLRQTVIPDLQARFPEPPPSAQTVLSVYGLPEPEVESRIHNQGLPEQVELAFTVDLPLVRVKLRSRGADAARRVDRAELTVRQVLGDCIVGVGDETLARNTVRLLQLANLSVALAESCTGGLIAKFLTDIPGASDVLERGIVSYANSAKRDLLGVPGEVLDRQGAVSAACARAMATGVRERAGTDLGLAVTGIAGPEGGSTEKPVGTVFIALASPDGERVEQFLFAGDRRAVRLRTAYAALDWLRRQAAERLEEH